MLAFTAFLVLIFVAVSDPLFFSNLAPCAITSAQRQVTVPVSDDMRRFYRRRKALPVAGLWVNSYCYVRQGDSTSSAGDASAPDSTH
jgi:hypothetical protein